VDESDETNNCDVNFVDCPPGKPDLIVEKSVQVPGDGTFIVWYSVKNRGGGPAGESRTCKYVDGVLQETQLCPPLALGAQHSATFEPELCPCGETLNVTVCADNDDVVDESDEENNCEVNFVDCPPCPPKPNLIVDKSVEVGDDYFIVSYTVTNIGGSEAAESTTCKYVDGVLQETQLCPALARHEQHSGAFEPEPCPCGETRNVTICADNYDDVDESDETNNCVVNWVYCLPCPPKPDLVVEKWVEVGDDYFIVSYLVIALH
jgi:subtilase family serine protease